MAVTVHIGASSTDLRCTAPGALDQPQPARSGGARVSTSNRMNGTRARIRARSKHEIRDPQYKSEVSRGIYLARALRHFLGFRQPLAQSILLDKSHVTLLLGPPHAPVRAQTPYLSTRTPSLTNTPCRCCVIAREIKDNLPHFSYKVACMVHKSSSYLAREEVVQENREPAAACLRCSPNRAISSIQRAQPERDIRPQGAQTVCLCPSVSCLSRPQTPDPRPSTLWEEGQVPIVPGPAFVTITVLACGERGEGRGRERYRKREREQRERAIERANISTGHLSRQAWPIAARTCIHSSMLLTKPCSVPLSSVPRVTLSGWCSTSISTTVHQQYLLQYQTTARSSRSIGA